MISAELKIVAGKHAGQTIPLDRKKFLIGREQDCQLRPNSELVSRHHCVFTVDDYSVRIRDLGSTNGTSVNGETIKKEVVLKQGDFVTVGSLEFQVTVNEASSEPQTTTVAASADDTIVAGTDTLSEMTPITEPAPASPVQEVVPVAAAPAVAEVEAAATPAPQPPLEAPDAHTGDTTVIAMPAMLPGQTPYQPMMPQQMGYPMYGNQQYPGMPMQQPYPGQPYPGQPYPPQPYPQQQMPMQQPYPQQMMPMQQPAPVAVEAAQQPVAASAAADAGLPEIALPDPSTTGAKAPPPKPPEPEQSSGEEAEKQEQSNQSADAIIKQYMQKRPGG